MKKNLFFGLCAASMLLMTSCDKEAFGGRFGEQETNVTLSVSLPELQTRAYGTGLNAKCLQYAVYSLDAQNAINEQIETKSIVLTKLTQNELSIKLVPGTKYAIVLWADAYGDNATSPFEVTMSTSANTLTVSADQIKTNDDNADAFFGSYEINVTAPSKYTITDALVLDDNGEKVEIEDGNLILKRPFAQLNIASTIGDYQTLVNSGFAIQKTKVTVKNAYSSMNLLTGAVGGEAEIAYDFSEELAVDQSLMTGTHKLLSVNYILMSADKSADNTVEFSYSDGTTINTKSYGSVPLRRNWRTNIYGELFTNPVGIKVSIDPNFADQTAENETDENPTLDTNDNDMYDVENNNVQ